MASLSNWRPLQTMSAAGVRVRLGLSMAELWMSMAPWFDVEAAFCYLCDILYSGAIAARCCVAQGKFRKLLSVLTPRYLSPWICGKLYEACICPNYQELQWHLHKDCAMIRWICGIKDRDEIPSGSRLQKLGTENITSVLRFRPLSPVSNISQTFRFQALKSKGGLGKHVSKCGLAGIDPLNRAAWRARVQHNLLLPTPLNGTWTTF